MLKIKKFWGNYCVPCASLSKIIKPILSEYPEVKLTDIDVEENDDLCVEYNIRSIPVLVFEVDGKEVDRLVGMQSREKIVELIKKYN